MGPALAMVGVGEKFFGALTMVLGAAVMVSGEPFNGLTLLSKGCTQFLAGNAIKSAVQTYGQSVGNGKQGIHESGTEVVERFGDNFGAGMLRPW